MNFLRSFLWNSLNKNNINIAKDLFKNKDNFESIKNNFLVKILNHAKKNVPYYKEKFSNIDFSNFQVSDLYKLPILTKKELKKDFEKLKSNDIDTRKWWENTSWWSTWEPVIFIQDEEYQKWVNISLYYYYKYILDIDWANSKKVIFWGSPKDISKSTWGFITKLKNYFLQTIWINAFTPFNDKNMKEYINIINSFKPDIIKWYTSSLLYLAKFAKNNNIKMHSPKIVMTAAEPLDENQRLFFEDIFWTHIINFYWSRETSSIAWESYEKNLLIFEFNNIVEIVNWDILVTNLHNYSMPLIRFKIWDISDNINFSINKYNLPIMTPVTWRFFDIFIKTNWEKFHSQFIVQLLFFKDWINKFQIIQEKIDKIILNIELEKWEKVNESEKKNIELKIINMMWKTCIVEWNYVDKINKTKNWKYLYTINKLIK